jgi:hypothetical protein
MFDRVNESEYAGLLPAGVLSKINALPPGSAGTRV